MDFRLPEIGEGVYEAELVQWLVKPGDKVNRGHDLAEVMTDKATMNIPAPFIGVVGSLRAEPGQKVKVGDVILTYELGGNEAAEEKEAPMPASPGRSPSSRIPALRGDSGKQGSPVPGGLSESRGARSRTTVRAAPSVRLMARKLGIDLGMVPGSGPGGRILHEDLSALIQARARNLEESPLSRVPEEIKIDYGQPGTRIKMVGLRRAIARRMAEAKAKAPHYSYIDECDVTELVRLRDSLRQPFARAGIKLTYLAFFVKATVAALKEVPIVNSSLDETAGEIVLHDRYHIGIAVSTPAGLFVPVVRDADKMDLPTIARQIDRLSTAARKGEAKREELTGSTFTITSVGNIGGLISTPVINLPEVGILGIGKVVRRPVYVTHGGVEQIQPAHLVYLSLSFDHRVVDGAVGARFTNVLMKQLQNPSLMLLPPLTPEGAG